MTTRLTESTLRRIVREEAIAHAHRKGPTGNTSERKSLKESRGRPGADEDLSNAMMAFVEGWMDESGEDDPQAACDALMREARGFCSAFLENS